MYKVSKEIMNELNTLKNSKNVSTINELMIELYAQNYDLYSWFYKSDVLLDVIAKERAVIDYVLYENDNFEIIDDEKRIPDYVENWLRLIEFTPLQPKDLAGVFSMLGMARLPKTAININPIVKGMKEVFSIPKEVIDWYGTDKAEQQLADIYLNGF